MRLIGAIWSSLPSMWRERDGLLVGATQGDVSGFMEGLRGHAVESRSIARKLSCLRGFYRWLLMDKRIAA